MLRLKNLSNKYQKRTCRPVYAQTQATPYAATLYTTADGSKGFRDASGNIQKLVYTAGSNTNNDIVTRTNDAFQKNNSYLPGMVVTKVDNSEDITIAAGLTTTGEQPFGLLANFVGGDFDEGFSGDRLQNEVGVWRGPDAVFEILAPAYHPDVAAGSTTAGTKLYAGNDGRLTISGGTTFTSGNTQVVARLIKKETNRILVDLAI
jgi:hypothetical protein